MHRRPDPFSTPSGQASPLAEADALVVLGCRVENGLPGLALERRLMQAKDLHRQNPNLPLVFSGGQSWQGTVEADAMRSWWEQQGGATDHVHLERRSLTTRQNAEEVNRLCRTLGYRHIVLVTCDFHMARATRLFRKRKLEVTPCAARATRSWGTRQKLRLREWGASVLALGEGWLR